MQLIEAKAVVLVLRSGYGSGSPTIVRPVGSISYNPRNPPKHIFWVCSVMLGPPLKKFRIRMCVPYLCMYQQPLSVKHLLSNSGDGSGWR